MALEVKRFAAYAGLQCRQTEQKRRASDTSQIADCQFSDQSPTIRVVQTRLDGTPFKIPRLKRALVFSAVTGELKIEGLNGEFERVLMTPEGHHYRQIRHVRGLTTSGIGVPLWPLGAGHDLAKDDFLVPMPLDLHRVERRLH